MTQACPGVCNAAYRATGEGQPRPGEPVWCGTCKAAIRYKFADLDYQIAVRAFRADGHHAQSQEPGRGSVGPPSPSQPMDDVEEATGWVWDWEDAARKEMGLPASFHTGYLPDIRSKVIAWLAERLDSILELPFAADFGAEVTEKHWELLAKNNDRPPRTGLVNCPVCGYKLAWLDGRDGLKCSNPGCHRIVTAEEYDADVKAARRELERAG